MQPSQTNQKASRLAARHYFDEIRRSWPIALPALLLPGIGTIFVSYLPPLVIAHLIQRFSHASLDLHNVLPYVLLFACFWFIGELLWRIAFLCLNRLDSDGMRHLYNRALEELLKKDIGFFHDNFAGSLTKK